MAEKHVRQITQDPAGNIWMITNSTVIRHDGQALKSLKIATLSQWDNLKSICATPKGDIYIGGQKGLRLVSPELDSATFIRPRFNVESVVFTDSSTLWTVSLGSIYRLETHSPDKIEKIQPPEYSGAPVTFNKVVLNAGKLYALSDKGIYTIDRKANTLHPLFYFGSTVTDAIFEKDRVWFGTEFLGLGLYDKKSGQISLFNQETDNPQSISSDEIMALTKDVFGNIWIGTRSAGLNLVREEDGKIKFRRFLSDSQGPTVTENDTRSLYADKNGTVWSGTFGNGVDVIELYPDYITGLSTEVAETGWFGNRGVSCISPSGDDIWISSGTSGGGFFKFSTKDSSREFFDPKKSNLSYPYLNSILDDGQGKIWIVPHDRTINIFDPKTGKYEHYRPQDSKSSPQSNFNSFTIDKRGDIWFSLPGNGLYRFPKGDDWRKPTIYTAGNGSRGPSSNHAHPIFTDKTGKVWFRSPAGVEIYDPSRRRFSQMGKGKGISVNISAGRTAPDSSIWLLGRQFLFEYDEVGKRFEKRTVPFHNRILWRGMNIDPKGRIWLNSFKEIVCYNPKDSTVFNLGKHPDLKGIKLNIDVLTFHQGKVYAGSENQGVIVFPLSIADKFDKKPNIRFRNISTSQNEKYTLKDDEKATTLEIEAKSKLTSVNLDLYIPGEYRSEAISYFYTSLADTTEHLIDDGKLSLNNLPYGNTEIALGAFSPFGHGSKATQKLTIVVLKPIGYIYYISGGIILAIIVVGIWFYSQKRKTPNTETEPDTEKQTAETLAKGKKDLEFLATVDRITKANLSDPDFKIDTLLKATGMSRTSFFVKIKQVTNQSGSEYIKDIRFGKAKELLEQGDMNVSEVAYAVGFSDPRYFSKVFKKHFGASPSEYSRRQKPNAVAQKEHRE
ncbi:helix-turn-helix domain-containing protein [Fulvitalea axinellae]